MNSITEGEDRLLPPDADGVMATSPSTALSDLQHEIAEAKVLKEQGEGALSRARSSLESRAELRAVAYDDARRIAPAEEVAAINVGKYRARQWADLDASDFPRLRSPERKESALQGVALNMLASPDYAEELKLRSPALAESVVHLTEAIQKLEAERLQAITDSRQKNETEAKLAMRLSVMDATAMASVASIRTKQSAAVSEVLSASVEPRTVSDLASARLEAAEAIANARGELPASNPPAGLRPSKRPIAEHELSGSLRQRYIITAEKTSGLFTNGRTEFTHRHGDMEGKFAFSDSGKSLATHLEDKATVRSMIEVSLAKNWKEITVSGTDEFRRAAWLEARINGLEVRGFEPREADKKLLAELEKPKAPENSIGVVARDPEKTVSHGKRETAAVHVDGDTLTPRQITVLDNSRAFLRSKDFGPEWTEAAIRELESKLRGERVYIGQVVDYGAAKYKFEDKGVQSYFVTLKTPLGEQTVWGKDLASAMGGEDVGKGQNIVLQNTGKRDVSVTEPLFDDAGKKTGSREKVATRNEWTAQPLSRFSEQAKRELDEKTSARQPALSVYDVKAPRKPEPSQPPRSAPSLDRAQIDHRRPSRDRE